MIFYVHLAQFNKIQLRNLMFKIVCWSKKRRQKKMPRTPNEDAKLEDTKNINTHGWLE